MNISLMLTTGALILAFSPRTAAAAKDNPKSQGTEEIRLERKCEGEAAKDLRDATRDRRNARRDNKWDERCAPPPPPPPPVEEPVAEEPVLPPPPPPMLPPGVLAP